MPLNKDFFELHLLIGTVSERGEFARPLLFTKNGKRGIRTPGGVSTTRPFQGRTLNQLRHLSKERLHYSANAPPRQDRSILALLKNSLSQNGYGLGRTRVDATVAEGTFSGNKGRLSVLNEKRGGRTIFGAKAAAGALFLFYLKL